MTRHKPKIVWLQAITCNGNTHSLLSSNSSRFELFLNSFDLFYHPSLTTDTSLDDVINLENIDFLLIEGAITSSSDYFTISDNNILDLLIKLANKASYIISVGSCASFGGIHAKFDEDKSIKGVPDYLNNLELNNLKQKIINLTGCPVHPEWILQTLFTLKNNKTILLDDKQRPKEIYYGLAHHGCTRNEYFEWKVEAKSFGIKEGCLFYEQGCRGPMTHSNCNRVLWNDVNTKTRAGMPCIGCTEFDFPRENMLETKKNIGIPTQVPLGINKRAYLTITGVAKTFKIDRLNNKLINKEEYENS